MMTESEHESYRSTLEAKLQPARIRSTLAFTGLYQITHELIKESVIDELRNFYFAGIDETGILVDERRYAAEVLALDLSCPDFFGQAYLGSIPAASCRSSNSYRTWCGVL